MKQIILSAAGVTALASIAVLAAVMIKKTQAAWEELGLED